jgi:hypothetical protein
MKRFGKILMLAASLVGYLHSARANEYTDVIDAFDDEIHDPFDLNFSVGYERFQRSATIRRETFQGVVPHDWDYFAYQNMFKYKQVTHILNLDLEVGIYKDISFRFGLPLILNDTRELRAHGDWDGTTWNDVDGDGQGDALFRVPLISPDRSGIDYIAFGLWWGILDQSRDETKPNWTIFAEGRIGVGKKIVAACQTAGGESCADSSRNLETKSGVSRGLNEINFGTRLSRRYGMLDPYFGIDALIGWAKEGTGFLLDDKAGQLNTMPPVVGTLDFGLEIVPWEIVEKNIKLSVIVGATGKYYSEGREYTPLFDALGVDDNDPKYFTTHLSTDFNGNGVEDELESNDAEAAASWSGMTDVENYAMFQGKLVVAMQPAKYVKFHIGMGLGHETEHFITKTDQCSSTNILDGQCIDYNDSHRPAIDTVGNRFRAEKTLLWTFLVDATAMF